MSGVLFGGKLEIQGIPGTALYGAGQEIYGTESIIVGIATVVRSSMYPVSSLFSRSILVSDVLSGANIHHVRQDSSIS